MRLQGLQKYRKTTSNLLIKLVKFQYRLLFSGYSGKCIPLYLTIKLVYGNEVFKEMTPLYIMGPLVWPLHQDAPGLVLSLHVRLQPDRNSNHEHTSLLQVCLPRAAQRRHKGSSLATIDGIQEFRL